MSFAFFKQKSKAPAELVCQLQDALLALVEDGTVEESLRAKEEAARCLQAVRAVLSGDGDGDVSSDLMSAMSCEAVKESLLPLLVVHLQDLDWEGRKDAAQLWCSLIRQHDTLHPAVLDYLCQHQDILDLLMKGYESSETALNCGTMLRECIRNPILARMVLYSPGLHMVFQSMDAPSFDIITDAFLTFKDLLRRHKKLVSEFLDTCYQQFFGAYEVLLRSTNYVTRRQSLKLLGEILLDRANGPIMMRFIGDPHNLRLIMNLLRDESRNIQFEAFHIFKVFVANPNKTKEVSKILKRNRENLLTFLRDFSIDKEDEQFEEEKGVISLEIEQLE